ncbi:SGNH/GDSL hydrolase family protein [Spirosoma flavus]
MNSEYIRTKNVTASEKSAINSRKASIIAILIGVLLCVIMIELIAQAFYFVVVKRQLDSVKNSAFFYLQKSSNDELGYELKSRVNLINDGRLLLINKLGVREKSDTTQKQKRRIGLLGDSVVFGINQSQDSTLSELTEDVRGGTIQVINLGVPGYATPQMVPQLKKYDPTYQFDEVVYLLNLNDFTLRNSIYEGADNGVYRYFNPPAFKAVWFLRKLIYRIKKKGEVMYNSDYYHWSFNGTKDKIFESLHRLKEQTKVPFSVIILPAGIGYKNNTYELADMTIEIEQFLKKENIRYASPVNEYSKNTTALLDETDHLTIKGNKVMAQIISNLLTK